MPSFFLKDTAPTEISPLPLHDALPISARSTSCAGAGRRGSRADARGYLRFWTIDRKSTRLNSSHGYISYAVFFFKGYGAHRDLPSSPTRRSSDLGALDELRRSRPARLQG